MKLEEQLKASIEREKARRNVAQDASEQIRLHVRECAMCRECVAYFREEDVARLHLCDVGKNLLLEIFN